MFKQADVSATTLHRRVELLTSRRIDRPAILSSLLALLAVAYFIHYISTNSQFPADDAYIHMRIARNFATHGTPYFNQDQAVSGSSSTLWLLLLTGIFRLGRANAQTVTIIVTLFTIGVFGACTRVLSGKYTLTISVILSFFLVAVAVVNTAALLMETPAALFFWLLSIICFRKTSFLWAGFCAGLSFATRYEFIAWVVILAILAPTTNARWRTGLGAIIPVAGVALFNMRYFGTLLPNTVRAKSIIYALDWSDSLGSALSLTSVPLFQLLLTLNAALALYLYRKRSQALTAGMLLFGSVVIGLYVLRKTLVFSWYIPIFLFPLLLSYCVSYRNPNRYIYLAVTVLAIAFAAMPLSLAFREGLGLTLNQPQLYRDYVTGLRVGQYIKIANELAVDYPHASLMTSEIGGLGWAFPGDIIDAAGLVSPECLKYHPMLVPTQRSSGDLGAIPPQAVYDLHPDLIVSMEIFSEALRGEMAEGRMTDYRLLAHYPVLGDSVPTDFGRLGLWGSRWIQVFVRAPV